MVGLILFRELRNHPSSARCKLLVIWQNYLAARSKTKLTGMSFLFLPITTAIPIPYQPSTILYWQVTQFDSSLVVFGLGIAACPRFVQFCEARCRVQGFGSGKGSRAGPLPGLGLRFMLRRLPPAGTFTGSGVGSSPKVSRFTSGKFLLACAWL